MTHKPTCETVTLADNATNRWWPVCDCGVDPDEKTMYGSDQRIAEDRRIKMDICEHCGETGHWEDECEEVSYDEEGLDRESYDIRDFIGRLETFLEGELDTISRGNVFMAENGNGVSLNPDRCAVC